MIMKVLESWKIKLSEGGKHLVGSLANFSFRVDQKVWCYWKTVDDREKNVTSRAKLSKFGMIPVLQRRSKQMKIKRFPYQTTLKRWKKLKVRK